jgi:hypothetical protein
METWLLAWKTLVTCTSLHSMIGYDIWIQLTFQRTNGNLVAGLDLVMILVMSCVLIYFELLTQFA